MCAYCLLVLLLLVGTSCASFDNSRPTPTPISELTIDPVFREFYHHLGGEQVLGRPISAGATEGTARVQYVQKAKMVFDPARSIRQRFTLAPLGIEMGVKEPQVLPPEQAGYKFDGGHVIGPEYLPLYESLGAYIVGKPLTEVRYNPSRRRHEQFFESVGFYRLEGSDQVRLLDYGVWACDDRQCPHAGQEPSDASIDLITRIDPTFVPFVERWGADFTGFAISEPYLNDDGNWEQIFECVVLQANKLNDPTSVTLRPLTRLMNTPVEAPIDNDNRPNQHFYTQENDGRGYAIPDYFWEYLEKHGVLELSGPPITHLSPFKGNTLHQCFENLCLMYDPQAPPPGRVRTQPIGQSYKTLFNQAGQANRRAQPLADYQIRIWERYPYVSPGQEQEVGLSVMHRNLPLAGVQPTLVVTLLDGKEMAMPMPATDSLGRSNLKLASFRGPSGSLIQYKICMPLPPEQETCREDSFVLWDTP